MSTVNYNLNNGATLSVMAPAPLAAGGFGAAALPAGLAGAGIYIILNDNHNNRYVGVSNDLAQRFQPRLETVTEMGFDQAEMNDILVWWGGITIQNTPAAAPLVPAGGPPIAAPAAPPVIPVLAYNTPLTVLIDGVGVNLERLAIRYVLTQLGAGGTVSNNQWAVGNYVNPTPNPVTVNFTWAAAGNYAMGVRQAIWPVGGVGW